MYPNLRAEMARKKITVHLLWEMLNHNGVKISESQLSLKLSGRYGISLEQAKEIKKCVGTTASLDYLFET